MLRVVKPNEIVVQLPTGGTATFKQRLNAGEQFDVWATASHREADGTMVMNRFDLAFAELATYLLDWSLTDVPIKDRPADEVKAALRGLDAEDFAELHAAMQDHKRAMQAARESEKKTVGPNGSDTTSPSPAGAAGPTPTFLH